jgi:hypothetical protein
MTEWLLAALLIVHAVSTLMMTGLIWVIQLVHYPLFARVGEADFVGYGRAHTRRITWLVAPLMGLEGLSGVGLLLVIGDPTLRTLAFFGTVLLALIWLSTAFLQVPCHEKLGKGFDVAIVRRLVTTNWIRTIGWSLRGAIAITLLLNVWPR